MRKIIKNKKGQVAEGLLVFLVVFLVGVTLFKIILFKPSAENSIAYSAITEEVYAKETAAEFYVFTALEDSVKGANGALSEDEIKNKFVSSFAQLKLEGEMALLKQDISEGKYKLTINSGEILFELDQNAGFTIDLKDKDENGQEVEIIYKPKLYVKVRTA